ncbi:hypothetical protein GCM10010275_53430 [Streptomyces litmocidini]|nr:hypothetical protein GCM10010275_53430 [Streptomyces litmocidini]
MNTYAIRARPGGPRARRAALRCGVVAAGTDGDRFDSSGASAEAEGVRSESRGSARDGAPGARRRTAALFSPPGSRPPGGPDEAHPYGLLARFRSPGLHVVETRGPP